MQELFVRFLTPRSDKIFGDLSNRQSQLPEDMQGIAHRLKSLGCIFYSNQ